MTLNWLLFLPALAVLFFPLEIGLPKRLRLKRLNYVDFGDAGLRRRGPWRMPAFWIDGARAFLAAFMLVHAWTGDPVDGVARSLPALASLPILALALVVQMHTRRNDDYFLAPVLYCVGLWLALAPLPVALVATSVGGIGLVAFRSLPTFFFLGSMTLAVFGKVVLHGGLWVVDAAILGLIPWALNLVIDRPLALPFKAEVVRESSRRVGAGSDELGALER